MIYLQIYRVIPMIMLTCLQFCSTQDIPKDRTRKSSTRAFATGNFSVPWIGNISIFQIPPKTASTTTEPGTKGVSSVVISASHQIGHTSITRC